MHRVTTLAGLLVIAFACLGAQPPPILEPGKGWELLGAGFKLTADSTVDDAGNLYFTDSRNSRIGKVDVGGKITIWKNGTGGDHGIAMGPDGRLYTGQHDRKRIVAYTPAGQESIVTEEVQTHHLTVTQKSEVYFSDGPNRRIWLLDTAGKKRVVNSEMTWPHGLRLSADQRSLIVTDSKDGSVWRFQVQADGSLKNGSPFYRLQIRGERSEIDPGGVTIDSDGYVYVATKIGVQVCDPSGRVTEVIRSPGEDSVNNVYLAGPNLQWLYVTDGERIFRRPVKRRGVPASRRP